MKLSFILSSLRLSGGVRCIVENANRLVARGHQVCLVTPGGTLDPDVLREINPGVRIKEVKEAGVGHMTLLRMLRLTIALAASVPPSDFVISTQSPTTAAGFVAAKILRRGRPVWYYQDYLEMFLDRPIIKFLLKNALRWHDCALVVSEYCKEELHHYVPGKRIFVVSEGLSHTEYFQPYNWAERQAHQQEQQTILFLGDMRPRKGWFDFFSAMRIVHQKYPNTLLWIVSKDPCDLPEDLPHKFIYRPTRKDLAHLYATCDVFVSASWWESFGIPPLEAMACGAPVVMTDSRGGRDYARPGENCLMVSPRDPESLANAVMQVLQDSQLAERLREKGPIMAGQFTWEVAFDRFENALVAASAGRS